MTLGNPLIRSFQGGGYIEGYPGLGEEGYDTPQNFDIFMSWMEGYDPDDLDSEPGEFLSNMLQYVFGLQDPDRWAGDFANFDEAKLYDLFDALKQNIKSGETKAGKGSSAAYNKARELSAKGTDVGFGAVGRSLLDALNMISQEKSLGRTGAQQTYESGAFQEQENWVDEFEEQLENIADSGAVFCNPGEVWNGNLGDCVDPWTEDDEGNIVLNEEDYTWGEDVDFQEWLEYDPETGEAMCPPEVNDMCASLGKDVGEDCNCVEAGTGVAPTEDWEEEEEEEFEEDWTGCVEGETLNPVTGECETEEESGCPEGSFACPEGSINPCAPSPGMCQPVEGSGFGEEAIYCEDDGACNTGDAGDCIYPEPGFDCFGTPGWEQEGYEGDLGYYSNVLSQTGTSMSNLSEQEWYNLSHGIGEIPLNQFSPQALQDDVYSYLDLHPNWGQDDTGNWVWNYDGPTTPLLDTTIMGA